MTELPMVIWVETVEGHIVLINMKVKIITLWSLIPRVNSPESKHLAQMAGGGLLGSTGTRRIADASDQRVQGLPAVIREAWA